MTYDNKMLSEIMIINTIAIGITIILTAIF